MFIKRAGLCAAFFLLACSASAAQKSDAVARLQHFLNDVETLKADFTQTVTHSTLPGATQSHGTVLIKRPNRFRWNYAAPNKQVIDSDGEQIWIYDAELEQVTVKPLKAALASSAALLLSGQGSLNEGYRIIDSGTEGGLDWVTLSPKKSGAAFSKIRIGLGPETIRVMELTGANLGQVTRIEFDNVARNEPIADKVFQFTPPPGADVIEAPH
ncbi:MAG TPA: outer membrane lipoprotein chaperone LolA [Gammaproteobacteria bacterium]|nr:outer membrane lipoprotein chaperone LolA [Gammaproteobacteria bacterium]